MNTLFAIEVISGWLASNPVVGALLPSGFTERRLVVTPMSGCRSCWTRNRESP